MNGIRCNHPLPQARQRALKSCHGGLGGGFLHLGLAKVADRDPSFRSATRSIHSKPHHSAPSTQQNTATSCESSGVKSGVTQIRTPAILCHTTLPTTASSDPAQSCGQIALFGRPSAGGKERHAVLPAQEAGLHTVQYLRNPRSGLGNSTLTGRWLGRLTPHVNPSHWE